MRPCSSPVLPCRLQHCCSPSPTGRRYTHPARQVSRQASRPACLSRPWTLCPDARGVRVELQVHDLAFVAVRHPHGADQHDGKPQNRGFPCSCPIRQGLSGRKVGLKRTSALPRPGVTRSGCFSSGPTSRNKYRLAERGLAVSSVIGATHAKTTLMMLFRDDLRGLPSSRKLVRRHSI